MEVLRNTKDPGFVLGNALDLVGPLASKLDGRLDSLGTSTHGQTHVVAKDVANLLGPLGEDIVVESARAQGEAASLLGESLDELGVAVTLVDGTVGREEVEVLAALRVPDIDTLGAGKDNGKRMVVVSGELVLGSNGALGRGRVDSGLGAVGVGRHVGGGR